MVFNFWTKNCVMMDLFRVTEHFLQEIQQGTWTFQYWILESVGEWNGKERAGGKHSFISMILQLIPLYIHPHDPAVDSTLHSSAWSCSWFHFTFISMILQLIPLYYTFINMIMQLISLYYLLSGSSPKFWCSLSHPFCLQAHSPHFFPPRKFSDIFH